LPSSLPDKTRSRTISKYFKIYAGPEYDIHFRYAELEMICYICFLFGPGIPIVFPLGFICLCIIYMIEKYSLVKLYKKPPLYSISLTINCLTEIEQIPILYLMFGFWMFSNKHMFNNAVIPIDNSYDVVRYDHNILQSLVTITPGLLFLITLIILIIMHIIPKKCQGYFSITKETKIETLKSMNVDYNFFQVIIPKNKK